jgi:hypothetical protein
MQFADDLTISEAASSIKEISVKLTQSFHLIQSFCHDLDLEINPAKSQLIVFKVPARKVPSDFEVRLGDINIKRSPSVKLLGVTLDQHLTFGAHMDNISKKCQGVLGALSRASPFLSKELRRLAYVALVRSHLEYCSAVFASASHTQLKKLDVIQRIASRIITGEPRSAHSAPLLEALQLDSLENRRTSHISALVDSFITGNCHPIFQEMFIPQADGSVMKDMNDHSSRIGIGERRSIFLDAKFITLL